MNGQIDKCFHHPWRIASAYFRLRIVHHHTISHEFFLQIVSPLVFLDVGVLDPESKNFRSIRTISHKSDQTNRGISS